jgi:hypothetical protein
MQNLQDAACECYGSINEYYRVLTGWQPATAEKIAVIESDV